jgi:hypothetical protein
MITTDQVTALEAKLEEILDPRIKALVEKWSKNPEAKKSSEPIVFERCPEHDHVGDGVEAWKAEMDYDPTALIYVQGSPIQIIQIGKQIFHIVPMVDQDEDPDLLREKDSGGDGRFGAAKDGKARRVLHYLDQVASLLSQLHIEMPKRNRK